MSIPDALDLEAHRAQIALDLAQNESRIRPMTTTLPPVFYTKTMKNLRNLREIHDHDDTLHRFLGDAEAAIGNLIVLEAETAKERDAAQADATRYAFDADREKARAAAQEKHLRDVNEGLRERLARERVDAQRVVNDRDEAKERAAVAIDQRDSARRTINELDASVGCWIKECEAARTQVRDTSAVLGRFSFESLPDAAARIVRERDSTRAALADVKNRERTALIERRTAITHLEAERDTVRNWSTRYDALFTQSTHLAREVDRLKNEKADRIEAKPSTAPIKVGDRVVSAGECATVIGFFTSIAGVEFLAVETMLRGGLGRPYFWRRDLCNPAPVST